MLLVALAAASGCTDGGRSSQPSSDGSGTTTIVMHARAGSKSADIETGTLSAKTTTIYVLELGGGMEYRCVREMNGNVIESEHCKKVRSR